VITGFFLPTANRFARRSAECAMPRLIAVVLAGLCCSLPTADVAGPPAHDLDRPEFRALWVDAFHAGIRSPAEADALVAAALGVHINTLFVQVRRRGDALYTRGVEPPLADPAYDPRFDALDYIIEAAHRAGLEVHAWINAMPVWRNEAAPADAHHVFNQHGPAATGRDNWLTARPDGTMLFPVGYFLDPGHPDAARYLADIYLNIVRNYAVDGIHFDYVRYPETDERLPRGAPVGYNAVSLERFRRAKGRTDTPAPDDEAWARWRREQVTALVRRVYIEAKAIRPRVKVSAALIPWGAPPAAPKDFRDVAPMQRVFQDWAGWLKEGLLDLAVPMNYAREHDPLVRGWFNGWIAFEKHVASGRHLAVGVGAYLNTPENTLAQVERVRQPDGRRRAAGMSFFSYFSTRAAVAVPGGAGAAADATAAVRPEDPWRFLAEGAGGRPAVFTRAAAVPAMEWIEHPKTGWIAGEVSAAAGSPVDGVTVSVRRRGLFSRTREVTTDGNGWFGAAGLKPGRYRVWLKAAGSRAAFEIDVSAGGVARARLERRPPA
jgi:uncharacterized lipoprotein YddW (UPF0748 family)